MLILNNINHTNCLGYIWGDEVEKMLLIRSWVLRWLIKGFGVLASRESFALTHGYFSHFPVCLFFYIVCKLQIFWICYETLALMMLDVFLVLTLIESLISTINYFLNFFSTGLWIVHIWSINYTLLFRLGTLFLLDCI